VQAAQLSSWYLLRFDTNTLFCDSEEQICDPLVLRPFQSLQQRGQHKLGQEKEKSALICTPRILILMQTGRAPRCPLPTPIGMAVVLTSVPRPFQSPFDAQECCSYEEVVRTLQDAFETSGVSAAENSLCSHLKCSFGVSISSEVDCLLISPGESKDSIGVLVTCPQ